MKSVSSMSMNKIPSICLSVVRIPGASEGRFYRTIRGTLPCATLFSTINAKTANEKYHLMRVGMIGLRIRQKSQTFLSRS
jgi:hypothetical protein